MIPNATYYVLSPMGARIGIRLWVLLHHAGLSSRQIAQAQMASEVTKSPALKCTGKSGIVGGCWVTHVVKLAGGEGRLGDCGGHSACPRDSGLRLLL